MELHSTTQSYIHARRRPSESEQSHLHARRTPSDSGQSHVRARRTPSDSGQSHVRAGRRPSGNGESHVPARRRTSVRFMSDAHHAAQRAHDRERARQRRARMTEEEREQQRAYERDRRRSISQYIDGRWICPQEAFWKIFKFGMYQTYPSVIRLQIHLPQKHQVQFRTTELVHNVLANQRNSRTMLTDFFNIYNTQQETQAYLYNEFPKHYTWNLTSRNWIKRRRRQKVVGRIYSVHPAEGERFYLRLLLNHIRGPKSFEDLMTIDATTYTTFKKAAEHYGLLERDNSLHDCMSEARAFRMPSALRTLFTTILLYCNPTDVRRLWNDNYTAMTEDYKTSASTNDLYVMNKLLHEIDYILQQHNKSVKQFDISQISALFQNTDNYCSLIEDELSIPILDADLHSISSLNINQTHAFSTIVHAIQQCQSAIFFIDGPGGTGKTFLYKAILAYLRKNGHIILATASSGIAATLLPGGTTAHLRFKIPIPVDSGSFCNFGKQSDIHKLFTTVFCYFMG